MSVRTSLGDSPDSPCGAFSFLRGCSAEQLRAWMKLADEVDRKLIKLLSDHGAATPEDQAIRNAVVDWQTRYHANLQVVENSIPTVECSTLFCPPGIATTRDDSIARAFAGVVVDGVELLRVSGVAPPPMPGSRLEALGVLPGAGDAPSFGQGATAGLLVGGLVVGGLILYYYVSRDR